MPIFAFLINRRKEREREDEKETDKPGEKG